MCWLTFLLYAVIWISFLGPIVVHHILGGAGSGSSDAAASDADNFLNSTAAGDASADEVADSE